MAAPIEQQVNGVEGMLYMASQMGNDGSYSLSVTFDVGTNLNTALVMVQNRVALAMPKLPIEVQNQGIAIRKRTPDILMVISMYSPKGRYDDLYLSNFATINVIDELLRVEGVSDVRTFPAKNYSIRVWLNPQKMASCGLSASDVAAAIANQNIDAPSGQVGQPPAPRGQALQVAVSTLGRLTDPEQFGEIIVKAAGGHAGTSAPPARARASTAPGATGVPAAAMAVSPGGVAGVIPNRLTAIASGATTIGEVTIAAETTTSGTSGGTTTSGGGSTTTGPATSAGPATAAGPATSGAPTVGGTAATGGAMTLGGAMSVGGAMSAARRALAAGRRRPAVRWAAGRPPLRPHPLRPHPLRPPTAS